MGTENSVSLFKSKLAPIFMLMCLFSMQERNLPVGCIGIDEQADATAIFCRITCY
jgi:hypothetical protein